MVTWPKLVDAIFDLLGEIGIYIDQYSRDAGGIRFWPLTVASREGAVYGISFGND